MFVASLDHESEEESRSAPIRTEPLVNERRTSGRIRTVFRVVRATTELDNGLCRIENMSDTGAMMTTGLELKSGDRISLGFSDSVTLSGEVVWTAEIRVGVRFSEPIDSAAVLRFLAEEWRAGAQRPPRLGVDAIAIATSESGLQVIRVSNISQQGMRIAHDGSLTEGARVKILLENGIERRAVVRWSQCGSAGVRLLEPIAYRELDSMRAFQSAPAPFGHGTEAAL